MDDNDLVEVNLMDLDLNQEPTDPPLHRVARYGSMLNDLETAHGRIEERIRQLEAVTARARQRQRWRQARNSMEVRDVMETRDVPGELVVDAGENNGGRNDGSNSVSTLERIAERGCKRDSSHLVAKALEMDSMAKKPDKEGGSFYDCNICLDVAREPVLTCCGHLFCWPCFYQVSDIDSTTKECPVCKGEVSNSTVIPIYGNGDGEPVCETEFGVKIPPRPKARRIESVRQQRVTQGLSHVPVAEALRRIRISIGAMGNQARQQEGGGNVLNLVTSMEGQSAELGGGHHYRIHQVSRVLSESVASLSSLSSALSNAERLVEDLETVIHNRIFRNHYQASAIDTMTPSVLQSNNQPPESAIAAYPIASSSQSTEVHVSAVNLLRARASSDVRLAAASSLRRRSIMTRISDLDSRDPRETRRRRLN